MNIKVKTISFLKPNPKPCVRRPCIWWGFLPSLTRTNMIWVDTRPKLDESPTNNKAQSYMVTSLIPPGSVAKSLNLGYQLPLCLEPTHYVLYGPTSLALWIEWLEPSPVAPSPNPPTLANRSSGAGYLSYMEVVFFVPTAPCHVGIGSLALRTDTLFTPAPLKRDWSFYLSGGGGDRYEIAPLMTPKSVTSWA